MKFTCIKAFSAVLLTAVCLSAAAQGPASRAEYIEKYKDLTLESMEVYGIPASVKMAQALLESDNGNSRLATQANNHFGIKCKKEWTGLTIYHDDDELQECFRKYSRAEESFRDHSEFLDKSPRYQELFKLDARDYKGWAYGLKAAGYATNPRYPEMLIKIIEDNQLYLLDEGKTPVIAEVDIPAVDTEKIVYIAGERVDIDHYSVSVRSIGGYSVYNNNGVDFIMAGSNDTYERLANVVGITPDRIRAFNDAPHGSRPDAGEMVYIKKKAGRSGRGNTPLHIVSEGGETLRSVAQKHGIRLDKIARLNHLDPRQPLSPGRHLRLK